VHARSIQGKALRRRMPHTHPHMHTCTSYVLLARSTAAFHLRHDLPPVETYFCGRVVCRLIMGYQRLELSYIQRPVQVRETVGPSETLVRSRIHGAFYIALKT